MTMHGFRSRCPVVGREEITFVELVTIGGEQRAEPFVREVLWLRESEARNVMRHRGEYVQDRDATYTDYYGFLTSSERSAVEAAAEDCGRLKITADSDLEILVEVRVFDRPVLAGDPVPDPEGRIPEYRYLGDSWYLPEVTKYQGGTEYRFHPRLEKRGVMPWTVVWSSKWGDGADDRQAQLLAQWREELAPAEHQGAGDA